MKPPDRVFLVAWLAVALISLILALLPVLVHAGRLWATYESPGLTVDLYTSPCDYPRVEAQLQAAIPSVVTRAAVVAHSGTVFPGCWAFDGKNVVVADVTGNSGFIPVADFKQDLV